jgi:hypothetical protein
MPGFNGTGPYGEGSMTGRKSGLCNPANTYGAPVTTVYGRRLGTGRRFMRGGPGTRRVFDRRFLGRDQPFFGDYNTRDTTDEMARLKEQANYVKNSLDAINKRIADLEEKTE